MTEIDRATAPAAVGASARAVEQLRFAPQILARLGEELNPNPDQGVLELVRNAYDADARRCRVSLLDISRPGGTIIVRDWGDGLAREAITDGWLVLGRSSKVADRRTKAGRLQVGSKGLGRLAALRQGDRASLRTWPTARRGRRRSTVEHEVLLEWSQFDEASTVDEVPVEVLTHEVESTETGTEIVIEDLHQAWSRPQVKRLARTLLLLADPFGSTDNSFELELACPEHPDLETLVASSYFDYAYWSLSAELDDRGRARMHLIDTRLGLDEYVEHEELAGAYSGEDRTYATLPATFELHGFLRSAEALHGMGTAATLEGLKAWLDAYGGVHIYHRGLRVAPYGDSGSDWLDMNLLRARNPEQRPSTSTAVGRVLVEDPTGVLVQKTDRSGFIEDDRFEELRRFGQDMIEYAGRRRTRVADEQRRRTKKAGPKRRARAKAKLDAEVKKLPPSQQKAVEKAVARYEREAEKDADQLRQDLLLYRTLATIGTTSAQIAHETFNPALALIDLAVEIEDLAREDFEEHWDSLAPAVEQIDALAQRLRDYARLPRVLLHEPKRRMKTFSADAALSDTVSVFGPLMKRHTVLVDETYNAADAKLRGPSALLDAIISNLLINAIHALDHQAKGQRRVLVRTAQEDDKFVLEVADNGPGITELDIDDIWVPGATTTPDGTGLGLTIVRDSAEQLGGGVAADAQGALGGAHFTIRIPVAS